MNIITETINNNYHPDDHSKNSNKGDVQVNNNIKIGIIEDDLNFCNFLEKKVKNLFKGKFNINTKKITTDFNNISNILSLDIIFIDIKLDEDNGIEIAKALKKATRKVIIIFISNYNNLVYNAFIAHPFYFIRKDHFNKDFGLMEKSLLTYLDQHFKEISIRISGKLIFLRLSDIIYIEAMLHKIKIYTINHGILVYNQNLKTFLKNNNKQNYLIQIHRSYAINIQFITDINNNTVTMYKNEKINIGKIYQTNFYTAYRNYMLFG